MRVPAILFLFIVWLASTSTARSTDTARSSDETYLDGLRHRHLYRLAQTFCLEQLARSDLSEPRRGRFVVQLSRCFAEHALHTKPSDREPLWEQAIAVTERFTTDYPNSPSWPLARLQTALVYLAHGESLRRQIELISNPGPRKQQATESLRAAIKITKQLERFLGSQLRATARPSAKAGDRLDEKDLRWLQIHARFHHARALRNQGELFPMGSPDRVAALRSAIELFGPLAKLDDSQPLAWQSRVQMIACSRLMGNFVETKRQLQRWQDGTPSPATRTALQTQWLLLELSRHKVPAALHRIEQQERGQWYRDALWDDTVLQVFLSAAAAAAGNGDTTKAAAWRNRAAARLPHIQRYGSFWKSRAETLLARSMGHGSRTAGELRTLARAAAGFYRSGEIDEALKAYDRARGAANEQGAQDQYFDLSFTAAAIENERKHYTEAAKRFRALALAAPKHPRAAEAHLLAVFNRAQAARQRKPVVLDEYLAWLDEHIRMWPHAKSTDQARWWQGQVYEQQGKWDEAIAVLRGISPDHKQFLPALHELAECFSEKFAEGSATGEDLMAAAQEATAWFRQLVVGSDNRWPQRWSPNQLEAALIASRFMLKYTGDSQHAEEMLRQAFSQARGASESWNAAARGLLALALVGQRRTEEAIPLLEQLLDGTASQRLELLQGIERIETGDPSPPEALSSIRLKLAQSLESDQHTLSESQRRAWQLAWARSLSAAGQLDEAARRYAALLDIPGNNSTARYEYAQLLSRGNDHASLEQALALWREVLGRAKPQSQRWFEAKYQLARAHFHLGDSERAAKIIRLTQVLHPELGNPRLKAQFIELLTRCEQPSSP